MRFRRDDALLVVDVQRDFCPGGALAIAEADAVVPVIDQLVEEAVAAGALVVASRDWHPKDHLSFYARGGPWPEHCVQDSEGAKFHADLRLPANVLIISKGADAEKEQYSAFDGTGLSDQLHARGIHRVFIVGLALDVCVRASALDSLRAGFETHVVENATRPVSPSEGDRAISDLRRAGAIVD